MEYLLYMQIFASYFCAILMYFAPALVTYKTYALVLAVITSLILFWQIIKKKGVISKSTFGIAIFYIGIIICYKWVTPMFYSDNPVRIYSSQILAIAGQILPYSLLASFAAENEDIQQKIKELAPYVGIAFSLVAFVCAFHPTATTSGGLADNENGMNYQNISYVAAYSAALMEYYLLTHRDIKQMGIFQDSIGVFISFGTVMLDFVTVLLSGGRGGFVVIVLFTVITAWLAVNHGLMTVQKLVRGLALAIAACVGLAGAFYYAANSSLKTSGFGRIMRMLGGSGDTGRSSLRERAMNSFQTKPILGHGFGSVFWEVGHYSHNFFTDVLVEIGIIGLIAILVLLVVTFCRELRLIKRDYSDILWMYIFLCGFIMAMFSGYYLTHISSSVAIAFIISKSGCVSSRVATPEFKSKELI